MLQSIDHRLASPLLRSAVWRRPVATFVAVEHLLQPSHNYPPRPRRHFGSASSTADSDKALRWVPLAYRGAVGQGRPTNGFASSRKEEGNGRRGRRGRGYEASKRREESDTKRKQEMIQKETHLRNLGRDTVRLAREYQRIFSVPPDLINRSRLVGIKYEDEQDERKAVLRLLVRQVRDIFNDIHQADQFVSWGQIVESEELFATLCLSLQELVRQATGLCRFEANNALDELIALGEVSLSALAKLGSDRALVVESTRTWSASFQPADETHRRTTTLGSFLNALVGTFQEKASEMQVQEPEGPLAHEDPQLGVTQELFGIVMSSVAAKVKDAIEADPGTPRDYDAERDKNDRKRIEEVSKRMLDVLDIMPSTWLPGTESLRQVLEMLCRVGNLESARACHDTFKRHPNNQYRLRFSLVLQAYLEATKYETDAEKQGTAVEEAVTAFHKEWDENYPRHAAERVMHATIVLTSMCLGEQNCRLPDVSETAEHVVARTLGRAAYNRLQQQIQSDAPQVDVQSLPLVSGMAQLFANSGDMGRIESAKKILSYIMQLSRDGGSKFIVHPTGDAFNAVLLSQVKQFEGRRRKDNDETVSEKTLDYAFSLVDFMLHRREPGFWPTSETFLLLFRLILALNPADIGSRAENLLSRMEIRKAFARDGDFDVALSTYHRVLRCWMEAAKDPSTTDAAVRSLRLVKKLEVQSTPLLLSDREASSADYSSLYDITLRPTRKTFGLVQRICLDTTNEDAFVDAADVAFAVYERLAAREMLSPSGSDRDVLETCVSRLSADSPARKEAETRLEAIAA